MHSIVERVAGFRTEPQFTAGDDERKQLDERIARMAGGVALIRVAAATEAESKERWIHIALEAPLRVTASNA